MGRFLVVFPVVANGEQLMHIGKLQRYISVCKTSGVNISNYKTSTKNKKNKSINLNSSFAKEKKYFCCYMNKQIICNIVPITYENMRNLQYCRYIIIQILPQ